MSLKLKKTIVFFFSVLAFTGVLATSIELDIWVVTKFIKSNIIRFHVSWSVLCCILLGIIIESHIKKMLKYKNKEFKRKKIVGIVFVSLFSILIFSSFIIRQIKVPIFHEAAILVHWVTGITAIIVFLFHYFLKNKI